MKKYFIYLIIYSIGGFILERIINLIFLGEYYDNSVLYGPYQPLYGAGVLMAILLYDFLIHKIDNKVLMYGTLLIVSIITTGISEAVTGYGYQFLYNIRLWDYNLIFSCQIPYVCFIPTTLFGIISFFVIVYLHPIFKKWVEKIPKMQFNYGFWIMFIIFILDIIITFGYRLR